MIDRAGHELKIRSACDVFRGAEAALKLA